MNNAEKLAALQRWADAINASDAHLAALDKLMGLVPEGCTQIMVQKLQDDLTHATADLVGDMDEWLQWYRFENAMGKRKRTCLVGKKPKPVRNLKDLLWMIEVTSPSRATPPAPGQKSFPDGTGEGGADDLYWRLHGLSKSLEGSGRIDEADTPEAYETILQAMRVVRGVADKEDA